MGELIEGIKKCWLRLKISTKIKWFLIASLLIVFNVSVEMYKYLDHRNVVYSEVSQRMEILKHSKSTMVAWIGIGFEDSQTQWYNLLQSNRNGLGETGDVYVITYRRSSWTCERRSPSYFIKSVEDVDKIYPCPHAVKQAVINGSYNGWTNDYRDKVVMSGAIATFVKDTPAILLAEQDKSEVTDNLQPYIRRTLPQIALELLLYIAICTLLYRREIIIKDLNAKYEKAIELYAE